jgi:hypothetical protein
MIRRLATLYLKSWLLLAWSAVCVSAGAAWAFVAITGAFRMRGLL